MGRAVLKLKPGVNTTETAALNEAGISSCNLVRYVFDPNLGGLVQKLGGWTKFYSNTTSAKTRALWAFEDTEATAHLAVGTENIGTTLQAQLSVVTNGSLYDITPRSQVVNETAALAATGGSATITITDTTVTNINTYDSVYIPVHISIGGIVLFGLYACDFDGHSGVNTYTVQSVDVLGNPLAALSNSSSPTLPKITTTNASSIATVTLVNHGYSVGDLYPVLIPTKVGGVVFFNHYPVQSVVDANNFTITGTSSATSGANGYVNNNKACYLYSFGIGSVPPGTGYGVGGYGRGGYGTGPAVTPSIGLPIAADDWTIDNWGEILIASPVSSPVVLTTTGASGSVGVGTLTFSQSYTVPVGSVITVSGVSPSSWNGQYTVTASSVGSVSFASGVTSAQTVAGTITVNFPSFQPIYQWDSESGAPIATVISQGPPVNEGMFLAMPERQIIAYGSTFTGIQDPLLVRWCDLNNYSQWKATVTNQAGSFRLPKGSRIVGGFQGPQQALLWTDIGLWSMQYINQPYVYSFNEIGSGCGLIAKKAAGSLGGAVYWMGPSQFFTLNADGVVPLECPVWDVIFQELDQANLSKIRIAINSRFNEVAWYYPTTSSGGEVAAYVKYNTLLQTWDFGQLARSAWVDQSVLGPPIGADPTTKYIYQHETSTDADGQPLLASFQTGYFTITEGDYKTFVDQVWPDMRWGYYGGSMNATVSITFYGTDYPGQTPVTYGPYTVNQNTTFVTPRIRTRLLSIGVSSADVGSFWRLGAIRYRAIPDGKF